MKFQPEYRTLSAFVLASIVHNFPLGQANALQGSLVSMSLVQIADGNALLRQWLSICLGHLWQNYDKARWSGVRDLAHEKLYPLLEYPEPEVRTAAVYALGTFISSVTEHKDRTEHANNIDRSIAMTLINVTGNDMSPLVRMELVAALQWMVRPLNQRRCKSVNFFCFPTDNSVRKSICVSVSRTKWICEATKPSSYT